jgi:hypothetical protein
MLLTQYPIDGHLQTRESLSRWVVFIHNQVNKKLGSKELTYTEVVSRYRKSFTHEEIQKRRFNMFAAVIIAVISMWIYVKLKNK